MNAEDHLLETWAQELAELGRHVPQGLLAMTLTVYEENQKIHAVVNLDSAIGPRLCMDEHGKIQATDDFRWPEQSLSKLAELTSETGIFGRVGLLLWQRWHAHTMARASELEVDMSLMDVVQALTWPASSAQDSLEHLLRLDLPHQSRYRARRLEERLTTSPEGQVERL